MADLDLDALERETREHVSREPQMEDTIMALIARCRAAEARVRELEAVVRHLGGILGNIDERTMHHAAQRAQGESEVYRATLPELHALRAVAEAARAHEAEPWRMATWRDLCYALAALRAVDDANGSGR